MIPTIYSSPELVNDEKKGKACTRSQETKDDGVDDACEAEIYKRRVPVEHLAAKRGQDKYGKSDLTA